MPVVIATSSSEDKLERLLQLGADQVINYRTDPEWGKTARRLTGGRGVDHVVEIGGSRRQSVAACGYAVMWLVAMLGTRDESLPFVPMITRNIRITGLSVGSREHHLAMTRALQTTGLRPVIDSTFALEDIADAFRHQESSRHVGKICLEW